VSVTGGCRVSGFNFWEESEANGDFERNSGFCGASDDSGAITSASFRNHSAWHRRVLVGAASNSFRRNGTSPEFDRLDGRSGGKREVATRD
jgi:hypothetical protein